MDRAREETGESKGEWREDENFAMMLGTIAAKHFTFLRDLPFSSK